MTTRPQVVAEARSLIDVPFKHQGRSREGLDCVGVAIMVVHALGLSDFDITDYGRAPNVEQMRGLLEKHLDYVPFRDVQPGDILWLRAPEPQHLAIVTSTEPLMMVHAFSKVGRVVETGVDRFWRKHIVACFKYRGVE